MKTMSGTRNLVLCGMCAAITCILAPLSVPLAGGVPLSPATFSVMLAGVLLGGSRGAASQAVYLLLGAVGLPVFAGWTGGIGLIAGMTGGFLIGYVPLAFFSGAVYHRLGRGKPFPVRIGAMVLAMLLGTVVLYALGTAWFMVYTKMSLTASLTACVLPFLPGDFLKMAGVALVAPPIENALRHAAPESAASM
ncbi:MAG: biotin transporter BioY [Eubacteriales bacterium]|nr:biotin transporter BioY [Eubacteriales bacterium]